MRRLFAFGLAAIISFALLGAVRPEGLHKITSIPHGDGLRQIVPGGTVVADTFRLLVQDQDWVNNAAITAGWIEADEYYDQINESSDFEDEMRWGCTDTGNPNTPRYGNNSFGPNTSRYYEDNGALGIYLGFYAMRMDGLTAGHKVMAANLMFNVQDFATNDFTTGFIAARLDTIVSDYRMLDSVSQELDPSFLDISYNKVDNTKGTDWSPPLADRDDMHDWGPRSVIQYPEKSLTASTPVNLDVTDAVQQALDKNLLADTDGWLIFIIYHVGTTTAHRTWSMSYTTSRADGGNPCMVVETTNIRGLQPWSGGGIPFCVSFDDNYMEQQSFFDVMQDHGLPLSVLGTGVLIESGPPNYFDADSLEAANPGQIHWIAHTLTHPSLGDLTGEALDPEIGRWWFNEDDYFPSNKPDTLAILDFAWAGGGGTYNYGTEAIERMIDFGFRSSRASGAKWNTGPGVGRTTYLSWDAPVNMLLYQSTLNMWQRDGGGARSEAEIKEFLLEEIDKRYSDYGKAAMSVFTHNIAMNYTTPEAIEYTLELVDELYGIKNMGLEAVLNMRDGTRVPPYAVMDASMAVADSFEIYLSAAMHDSMINEAGGHDNMREVWVLPYGDAAPAQEARIEFDFPVFAHWGFRHEVYPPATEFDQAHVDSIATLDYIHFPQEYMDPAYDEFDGMTPRIREVNPNTVIVNYVRMFGVSPDWSTYGAGNYFYELWAIVDRNSDGYIVGTPGGTDGVLDFWLYDTSGDHIEHDGTPVTIYMINPAAPGIADTLANYYCDRLVQMGNMTNHIGVWIDWAYASYPDWPFVAGAPYRDTIDMDEDGVGYGSDSDEPILYKKFGNGIPRTFRRAAGREDFIIINNGSAGLREDFGWAYDGAMLENFESSLNPNDFTEWSNLLKNMADWSTTERVSPPLIMFQAKHDSLGPVTEALGSLARGLATAVESHWPPLQSQESFTIFEKTYKIGQMEPGSLTVLDTSPIEAEAVFVDESGVRTLVQVEIPVGAITLPFPYNIVRDFDTEKATVIARGGGWVE